MRYRLKLATWTVVREHDQLSPRSLSSPETAALFAVHLLQKHVDEQHFWTIHLNAQNDYLLHTEGSMGTQSASLVHPREVLGPAARDGTSSLILIHNHLYGIPRHRVRTCASRGSSPTGRSSWTSGCTTPPHHR